jgi:hypothetical protein
VKRLYALLLGLFPRSYREEYGDELRAVFNLSLDDALKQGKLEATIVVLRELAGLPKAIFYEYLRNPKHGLAAQPFIFAKGIYMETIMRIQWADEDSWEATLFSLLPLWLLSFAIMAEGFPRPPISIELAYIASFYLAIPVSIVLLWKGWLEVDILLYSLFPFTLLFMFDEISTTYKSPFILVCALILSAGIIGARRSDSVTVRWLILLLLAITTWALASHAAQNYWQMFDGFYFPFGCFPGTQECPLPANLSPWWVVFFSL